MDETDLPWVLATEQLAYAFPWSEQGFKTLFKQGINFVFCQADERLFGYACLSSVLDELEILNFCIHPRYQGQGAGFWALQRLLERFEDTHYQKIHLDVRASHVAAIRLYQKVGFQPVGVRPRYYRTEQGREDAVLMTLEL